MPPYFALDVHLRKPMMTVQPVDNPAIRHDEAGRCAARSQTSAQSTRLRVCPAHGSDWIDRRAGSTPFSSSSSHPAARWCRRPRRRRVGGAQPLGAKERQRPAARHEHSLLHIGIHTRWLGRIPDRTPIGTSLIGTSLRRAVLTGAGRLRASRSHGAWSRNDRPSRAVPSHQVLSRAAGA